MFIYSFVWCVTVPILFIVINEFIFWISTSKRLILKNLRLIKNIVYFESMQTLCNLFCLMKTTLQPAYFHPRNPYLLSWENENVNETMNWGFSEKLFTDKTWWVFVSMGLRFLKFVSISVRGSAEDSIRREDAIDSLILLNAGLVTVLNAVSLNVGKIVVEINEQRGFLHVYDLMCWCSLLFESNFLLHWLQKILMMIILIVLILLKKCVSTLLSLIFWMRFSFASFTSK